MSPVDSQPPYAALALALTEQHWTQIGQGDNPLNQASDDFETNVERVTALLLVRVVARVMEIFKQATEESLIRQHAELESEEAMPLPQEQTFNYELPFPDTNWSTTNICTTFLQEEHPWPVDQVVIKQCEALVRSILSKYNDVPYHNHSHATHVTTSTNKLIDMLWLHRCNSFGLRQNALSLMALVFAALTHDVEHKGLPNRQLAVEDDELAVLYNDQSIAEQRSLYVGFKELLKPEYMELRNVVFPSKDDYRDFRQKVVDLVMNTDIASPERTQLAKSKYVEAFGPVKKPGEAEEQTEDEVEESMLTHVRKMPMNTVKIINKGVVGVTGGVMTVADAGVSGVMNVAEAGLGGVKAVTDMSVGGVKNVARGVKGVGKGTVKLVQKVAGVRPNNSSTHGSAHGATQQRVAEFENGTDAPKSPNHVKQALSIPGKGVRAISGSVSGGVKAVGKTLKRASYKSQEGSTGDDSESGATDDSPGTPGNDIMNQAKKYTVKPVQHTVKVMSGGLSSFGRSLGLRNSASKRLGIRVSMDLTGECVEAYTNSPRRSSMFSQEDNDEIDPLKAAVLMDLIMTAADVSQNLQGYEQMCKWAGRLYNELRLAFLQDRGVDPKGGWYQNQIGFLEFYLAPLSQRLDSTGAYGPLGSLFGEVVEKNRDRWLVEGAESTNKIIDDGFAMFPGDDEYLKYLVVLEEEVEAGEPLVETEEAKVVVIEQESAEPEHFL